MNEVMKGEALSIPMDCLIYHVWFENMTKSHYRFLLNKVTVQILCCAKLVKKMMADFLR